MCALNNALEKILFRLIVVPVHKLLVYAQRDRLPERKE